MRILACFLALAFLPSLASAQDGKISVEPIDKWSTLLAETKVELNFLVKVPPKFKGNVEWVFFDVGTKNVLPSGRGATTITADGDKPVKVKISWTTPPLRPGVRLSAQLDVKVFEDGKTQPETTYEKPLSIYHADPFADRTKWLDGLKITLFDPDAKSKTAEALKGLKVPFETSNNPAALADLKEGLLLIGEGVSFKEEAGLAEAIIKAASRGMPVLCLAPKDGSFSLPGADNALPAPSGLTFARPDIITKLDKHLDAVAWAPKNDIVAGSLAVKTDDGKVVGEFQDGAKGWPWLQLDYADKKGRLVICGFGIIRQWEASPTPRFLLARLFEHVTEPGAPKE